jgi:bacillolysin
MVVERRWLALVAWLVALTLLSGDDRTDRLPSATVEIVADVPEGVVTLRETGDGGPIGDREADEAFQYASQVLAYFKVHFRWSSFDGRGTKLVVVIRDHKDDAAASWYRDRRRIGVAEGYVTSDAVAHEFTHGVIQATVGLGRTGETGALNEALADIFASNVDNDWTQGDPPRGAFRDLANPARLGHPVHVSEYLPWEDVHRNSTIISHAYFIMAGEIGRPAAEGVAWAALTHYLKGTSGFEEFRAACLRAASERYGAGSDQRQAVDSAFHRVGLDGAWRAPPGS